MTYDKDDSKVSFLIATKPRGGEEANPYLGLLHFTLDSYLIMLSIMQGSIKYNFLILLYDTTWD